MLAVSVVAAAFVAPPRRPTQLGGLRVSPAQSLSVARRSAAEMRAKGDNMIAREQQDEPTWKEVLDEDRSTAMVFIRKHPASVSGVPAPLKEAPPASSALPPQTRRPRSRFGLRPSRQPRARRSRRWSYFTSLDPETTSYADDEHHDGARRRRAKRHTWWSRLRRYRDCVMPVTGIVAELMTSSSRRVKPRPSKVGGRHGRTLKEYPSECPRAHVHPHVALARLFA